MTKRELKTAMAQDKGLPEVIKHHLFNSVIVSQPKAQSMQVAFRYRSRGFWDSCLVNLLVKDNICMEVSFFQPFDTSFFCTIIGTLHQQIDHRLNRILWLEWAEVKISFDHNLQVYVVFRPFWLKWSVPHPITIQNMRCLLWFLLKKNSYFLTQSRYSL